MKLELRSAGESWQQGTRRSGSGRWDALLELRVGVGDKKISVSLAEASKMEWML